MNTPINRKNKLFGYCSITPTLNKNPADKTKELLVEDRFHFDINDDVGHLREKTLIELIHSHRLNEHESDSTTPLIHYKIYKLISKYIDAFIQKVQNLVPFGEGKKGLTLSEIEELHNLGEDIQVTFQEFWVPFVAASRKR